jgi:hypothetical protein
MLSAMPEDKDVKTSTGVRNNLKKLDHATAHFSESWLREITHWKQ